MLQCRQLFQIIRLYIGAVNNPLLFPTCSVSHQNPDTREALADKTASVTFRNAEEVALPPLLPLAFFLPPSPRPRSQSALPLRGRGRFFGFLMQGASPLASPGLNPRGTYSPCRRCCPAGGLPLPFLFCLPYHSFSPHPPYPLPGGKGETFSLFRRGLPPPAPRH